MTSKPWTETWKTQGCSCGARAGEPCRGGVIIGGHSRFDRACSDCGALCCTPTEPTCSACLAKNTATRFGVIVFDLAGGDATYHFVDKDRWDQIVAVHAAVDESDRHWEMKLADVVGWLTADDRPETDRPEHAPDRLGQLLKTVYTQTFVVKRLSIQGELLGILTFP